MKFTHAHGCPIPTWGFVLAMLLLELALWVALVRYGVASGWWSDVIGGVMVIALPFFLRFLVVYASYRASVRNGVQLKNDQQLHGLKWWKFFLVEYAHFCKQAFLQLPFPALFRSRSDRGNHAAHGKVILLQHGYSHTGAVWSSTTRALEAKGYRVYTIDQPQYAPIDAMADRLAQRIRDVLRYTNEPQLTLIAHSMGGLIARAYLRKYGSAHVEQLITLGSPHHGTHHASIAFGTNGRQMRPGNAWLAALNRTPAMIPLTSIYSVHDTVISPQDSSSLPGANNVELAGIGHVSMPSGRATRSALLAALNREQVAVD
jgi:triacylglycerol lipase